MKGAEKLDVGWVVDSLKRLRLSNVDCFGAEGHRFLLNPSLSESDVRAFEDMHNIRLPVDYRAFLLAAGNGGAGPYYGIFRLGEMDVSVGDGCFRWQQGSATVGRLAQPFQHDEAWNDLTGMPSLSEVDEDDYWRQEEEFQKRYWENSSLVNGTIPICHEGCAIRVLLVVCGPQAGYLWRDARSEYGGITPVRLANGSQATFSGWYGEWLLYLLQRIS